MRFQRVSPDVFPTEGRASRGRDGRRSRGARGARIARDAGARTIIDGIRAYLAADIASVRSVVTEDVTLRYIDRDGNPVVVTGVDAVIRLASDDARRAANGEAPLALDSADPKAAVDALMASESRFKLTDQHDHARYTELVHQMEHQIRHRFALYHELSHVHD